MIRTFGLSAIFAILALPGFAQDSTAVSGRRSTHYVGIQANQLIKQLLNLGGSTSAINNPYLITYSVNSNSNGVGLNLSFGYVLDETSGGDFQSQVTTKINEFFFRVGIEKKSQLGKRWILSAGGDIVADNKSNRTETKFNGSDTPSVEEDKVDGFGTGFRVGLNFHITDKILLGTEANYYFKFINTSNTLTQPFGSPVKHSDDSRKFQLNVPAVLFLVVKL
jgi:long-subunit fatty acid transport protein